MAAADITGLEALRGELVGAAMAYPDAFEDTPWGEIAVKVRKKAFVFTSVGGADAADTNVRLWVTVKVPSSAEELCAQPWAEPAGYGLGRHGWVTVSATDPDTLDVAWLRELIDESYRNVAPKTLVARLPEMDAST